MLQLGGNPLGAEGAEALAKGVALSRSLRELYLSATEVGDQGEATRGMAVWVGSGSGLTFRL